MIAELKIIMDTLSKMGEGAQAAFIVWCIKEVIVYSMIPATFIVVGLSVYKISTKCLRMSLEHDKD